MNTPTSTRFALAHLATAAAMLAASHLIAASTAPVTEDIRTRVTNGSVPITQAAAQGSGRLRRYDVDIAVDTAGAVRRTAISTDFNADGIADLVVAADGQLVFHRGNIDAFAPRTQAAWEAIRDSRLLPPFEAATRAVALPVAPDFIVAGDFNRDTHIDVVCGARGGGELYLVAGDGAGNFAEPRRVELGGALTALGAGDVGRADGLPDMIAAVRSPAGAVLQVFAGAGDLFALPRVTINLPAAADAITTGRFSETEFSDIAIAAGSEVLIVSGAMTVEADAAEAPEMVRLPQGAGIRSLLVGDFIPDRDARTEIALLTSDGSVRILQRGVLDTRPVTRAEHLAGVVRDYQAKGHPLPEKILRQVSAADLQPAAPRVTTDTKTWSQAEAVALPGNAASAGAVLASGRLSKGAADDLIVLDGMTNRVHVLPLRGDESGADAARRGEPMQFVAADQPVAVLPMRLNHDSEMDLLIVGGSGAEFPALISAPQASFTVTSNADLPDTNVNDGVCQASNGQCTLRAAIMQANKTAGNDSITINSGIGDITLTRGMPDDDAGGTNDEASGDLDITCVIDGSTFGCQQPYTTNNNDLTITGAAGGSIVQAGTFTTGMNGMNTDRVFDMGQDGIFGGAFGGSTGIIVSVSNLTIRNGNIRQQAVVAGGGNFFSFGGGIRYDGFGASSTHGSLSLTNVTVHNNQSDNAGGGVYQVYGTFNASGSTFSNNITKAGEGGGLFFGAATSNSNVNISTSTFSTNEARQGFIGNTFTANADGGGLRINADPNTVTINTTNFTGNIAQQDGGAIKTLAGAVTVTGGSITGNTARRHGGGAFGDQDVANTGRSFTFSGTTLRNNLANSDNVVGANDEGDAGDGGAIFRDRGVLSITNCTIGGTGASEPNTGTNGGGVAHAFTVDSASGNSSNQTTVTINGGSINGNIANADGGGVYFNAATFDVTASALSIGSTSATALTGNKAKNNGGGIYVSNAATAGLNNMTLRSNLANSDNSGGGDGGALYQDTAASATTFTGTLTIGGSGFVNLAVNGGGIRNNAGTVTIPSGATITHNTATGNGGGISNGGTVSALATATITNNTATLNGGGIHNTGTLGTLTTPALNTNAAASGGGIFSSSGNLVISGGSITGNTAGGGLVHGGTAASSVTNATISNNTGHGVLITANSLDLVTNTITGNTLDGIAKTGSGTGSHFNGNVIHNNGALAIDLSDNGVTPNDVNDVDTGPNNLQNFPVLNYVKRGDGVANVTLNAPNGKYRIQYYKNATCDASANGEGEVLLTSQVVDIASGNTLTFASPALAFDSGVREQITATATHDANGNNNFDDDGSTSEFSPCRRVNTLPTISAQTGVSRQQGSAASTAVQVATVDDIDETEETLLMTVNGGATATVNGVTVSNLAVSSTGVVTATVVASCTATDASFTVRVTDNATEFNQVTLNVAVTANTAPTLGTYGDTVVLLNGGGTVTPSAAPTDNGTYLLTVTASPNTLNDDLTVNQSTGAVTITTAEPAGTYTVTVTSTDNCGVIVTANFQVIVNTPPTISAQSGVSRQQGSVATNSQVATLDDADQSEASLAVLVNGGSTATVNGVTVSNLAVSATGAVTADVVASCTATNASFTLRVTDANGAFTDATLSVNVTANSAPTVGDYANTSVNQGSGVVVTPSAAPADNGSIATVSAAASPASFTGTFSGNAPTGAITVSNAAPAGDYTITVTTTDNCGSTLQKSFTLRVTQAPAITSANTATFTVGTAGSFTVTASGFPAPTLSMSGTLPSGVTFNTTTRELSGTPAPGTGGVYNLIFTATNGAGTDATQNFTLTVNEAPSITSANSTTFTEGNFGSFAVAANGYPAPAFSATGTLPSGVTFAPSGLLSGTPAAGSAGNYQLQITASNGIGSNDVESFTLTVVAPVCVAPPADLVAWYPAEGNAIDVESGNNGTALNSAGYANAKVAQGFTFNGSTSVIEVPNAPAWNFGANNFTVHTWVNFSAISGSDVLVGHSEGSGSVNKWLFWLKSGKLEFHLNGSAVSNITSDANFTPVLGRWYHVAVTRSGNTYKFYVDGVQNGTDRFDSNTVPTANAPLSLGKAEALAAMSGSLDEVQIFSRALTGSEIQSVYNASTEGFCVDAPAMTSAVSRKTHGPAGAFDLNLPLTGAPGVECRTASATGDHVIVVSFNNTVTEGNAAVSSGSVSGTPTFNGNTMTINLTGVPNAQQITVSLTNVKDGFAQVLPSASVPMNVLLGDTTGNKAVTASDIGQVKAASGQPISPANFRIDVSLNGVLNGSDLSMTKAAAGTMIP